MSGDRWTAYLGRPTTLGLLAGITGLFAALLEAGVQYGQNASKLTTGSALTQIALVCTCSLIALAGASTPRPRLQAACLTVATAGFFIDGFLNMVLSPVLLMAALLAGMALSKRDGTRRSVLLAPRRKKG